MANIILFYKYVDIPNVDDIIEEHTEYLNSLKDITGGRVLLSSEGINATLAAPSTSDSINSYIHYMTQHPIFNMSVDDFKHSSTSNDNGNISSLFPDLVIKKVDEIISTGHYNLPYDKKDDNVSYISPSDFHSELSNFNADDTIILDVRNYKEALVGKFEHATTPSANVKTFPEYISFLNANANLITSKKNVLMYCTGGVRCEKISSYVSRTFKNESVRHLKGGIHKYLEAFEGGNEKEGGYFNGKNFVFDSRVTMDSNNNTSNVIGSCIECGDKFDTFRGRNVCTVCRDLVLCCPACVKKLRGELHCMQHQDLKGCYFTFLNVLSAVQLNEHLLELRNKFKEIEFEKGKKNLRRTLLRQIKRVEDELKDGRDTNSMDGNIVPCRTCFTPECDGNCWGFWKQQQ